MKQSFDPDILAAAKEIQAMRNEGKLSNIKRIILNCCPQDRIRTIQREYRDEKLDLNPVA